MTTLVTGCSGFIGFHVTYALLSAGHRIIGVDNLNRYYDPTLKEHRLALLKESTGFTFHRLDIADRGKMHDLAKLYPDIDYVVHLAAQAGVRYSLEEPYTYIDSNITGQLCVLELCRHLPGLRHLVYASSSSVYGHNEKVPFSETDRVDAPASLYAVTKRAGELMAENYSRLFSFPATGLRFFTVYGPWGRPDMAYFIFTRALLEGTALTLTHGGQQERDFTYIDDIVAGVMSALERPPKRHALYNLGNHHCISLRKLLSTLETLTGRQAVIKEAPLPAGDVPRTFADITRASQQLGYHPRTSLEEGLPHFLNWYREYYRV